MTARSAIAGTMAVETLPVAAPEIVESHGQLYIAALLPSLKGIQVAKLGWEKQP